MKTIEKTQTKKAIKPASRWRNRYLALRDLGDGVSNRVNHRRGEEFWPELTCPSRDVADTVAQQYMAESPGCVEHLGAFPIEGDDA